MKKTKLQTARDRNEIARLSLGTAIAERRQKILATYDATETSKHRRQPKIERKSEDQIYPQTKRLKGASVGRGLERNYPTAKSIIHQFKVNVVGSLGKIQVNIEGGPEAAAWFNGKWAKDSDFRDSLHFSTQCQNAVAGVMRDGDFLAVVDDGVFGDTGKLVHWESDQIAPLSETALKSSKYAGGTQENGILRDKNGKVLAYVCTGKHGLAVIPDYKDATIWPRDQARLVKNPWRMNQGRGIPSVLTSANNFQDLYEILSKELQSAKKAAGQYASVERDNAVTDWDDPASSPEFLPENSGKTAAEVAAESAGSPAAAATTAENYERLEAFTGGYTDYMNKGDKVSFPDITRPNIHLLEFCETVLGHAGASVGLARAYTILKADSSYTAFRGDMILSWVTFYAMQKWLERSYADWVAVKVLAWAQRKKQIGLLPAGWEQAISWQWPTMPHVDELKEESAVQQSLKNATTDFSILLGPDWERKLAAYAVQLDKARELGIPLGVFETASGGAADFASDDPAPKKARELGIPLGVFETASGGATDFASDDPAPKNGATK